MINWLDTNACIGYLNGRAVGVLRRLQATPPHNVAVCSVVKAELFFGAMKSKNPTRTRAHQQTFFSGFVSLPFDDPAAEVYGRLRAELEAVGAPIGPHDLQIAIALANNLTYVTHSTHEFGRVNGLQIEDWEV